MTATAVRAAIGAAMFQSHSEDEMQDPASERKPITVDQAYQVTRAAGKLVDADELVAVREFRNEIRDQKLPAEDGVMMILNGFVNAGSGNRAWHMLKRALLGAVGGGGVVVLPFPDNLYTIIALPVIGVLAGLAWGATED